MKYRTAIIFVLMSICGTALATERYTEARITQVEVSEPGIYFFLQIVSGDATPVGNGGSNEPLTKSYLLLANTPESVASRKHMLSAGLVAMTAGTIVRFRWEDGSASPGWITVMLVRP